MAHYLICRPLWAALGNTTPDDELLPVFRCGLAPPSGPKLRCIAEAYVTYHCVKHGATDDTIEARLSAARRLARIKCS